MANNRKTYVKNECAECHRETRSHYAKETCSKACATKLQDRLARKSK